MNHAVATANETAARRLRGAWNRVADKLEILIAHGLLALAARVAVAAIFFFSGRTKVDGFLTVKDSTYLLFQ